MSQFTHINASGEANMVDVSAKAETVREARTEAFVQMSAETLELIVSGSHHKGDVFATARIARIQAAKKWRHSHDANDYSRWDGWLQDLDDPIAREQKRKKKTKVELPKIPTEDMALFQRWVPFWHDSLTTKPTKEEFYRLPGHGDLSARQAIGLDQYECKNVNKNLRADTIAQLFQTYLVYRGRRQVEQWGV